jgi:molybdopterin converting factor small subunit
VTSSSHSVRVVLPAHLRNLAQVDKEVTVEVADGAAVTQRSILDALERDHPALRGTMREHGGGKRRPFVRFFVGEEDRSHDDPDAPLPSSVAEGREVFYVVGAMAGG